VPGRGTNRSPTFHRLFAGGALVYELIYISRQYFTLLRP
jgi:hypothetical protein